MKLVFLSNYFNHHQKYISDQWFEGGENYCFVATSQMSEMRKKLGYGSHQMPAYVKSYDAVDQMIPEMVLDADAVIIGAAKNSLIRRRVKEGKLVFRYSERPFKVKDSIWKYIPRWIKWHIQYPNNKPVYLLCASAYNAIDYGKYGVFRNKCYKWGYFPETKRYDIEALLSQKGKTNILWCGRFIDWKHPDDAIVVARMLKEQGYDFQLNFVGTGIMEPELKALVERFGLSDCVNFLGSMSPEQVRKHMEKSGIYLFTSDRKEGWGAVLNESMNSGCAVIASHAIGSAPYLIQHCDNGLIYKSGNVEMLCERVKYLLDNPQEQSRLGRAAYHSIAELWNAEVAAKRLLNLTQHILAGEDAPEIYEIGPCSKAELVKDEWFNE